MNRDVLIEGNSLIISLIKTFSNDENNSKRINVQKIASLKDLLINLLMKLYSILNLLKTLIKYQI